MKEISIDIYGLKYKVEAKVIKEAIEDGYEKYRKNRNPLEIMPFEEFEANCTVIVNCD